MVNADHPHVLLKARDQRNATQSSNCCKARPLGFAEPRWLELWPAERGGRTFVRGGLEVRWEVQRRGLRQGEGTKCRA